MERITVTFFKKHFAEIFEKVKRGESMAITDNGEILAKLIPETKSIDDSKRKVPKFINTKEEFDAAMAKLDEMYKRGDISIEDCHLSKVEPIDMGPTDSSNLDSEIYK